MSVGKIRVELELDNSGMITGTIQSVAALKNLASAATTANGSVNTLKGSSSGLFQTFKDGVLTVGLLREALKTVYAATGEWAMGIVKTNAELQRMTQLMAGMSSSVSQFGKLKDAKEGVQWIIDFTKQAPFSMQALTDGFVKFKSVGIDPTKGSLKALSDAVAAFGGNDEIFKRATIAIQQMGGKGVVSMEELRQQLGEAVPQAINMMARASKMSYADLVKLISQGRVESTSALNLMFAEFDRTFGGKSQAMMKTWDGMIAQMKSSWIVLQQSAGEAGFFDEAQKQLRDLITLMNQPGSMELAKELGQGLTQIIQYARSGIEWVVRYRSELLKFGEILTTVFLARGAIAGAKGLFEVLNVFGPTVGRAGGFVTKMGEMLFNMGAAFQRTSPMVVGLGNVVGQVGISLTGFGGTLASLAGPIGIAITIIGLLTAAYYAFRNSIDETNDRLAHAKFYDEEGVKKAQEGLKDLEAQQQRLIDQRKMYQTEDGSDKSLWATAPVKRLNKEIDALGAKIEATKSNISRMGDIKFKSDVDDAFSTLREESQKLIDPLHSAYSAAMNAAWDKANQGPKQLEDAQKKSVEITAKYYTDSIKTVSDRIDALNAKWTSASPAEREAILKEIGQLNDAKLQLREQADLSKSASLTILPGKGNQNGALSKAETEIESYKAKIADLRAEMVGTSGELAKVNSMIAGGVFGNKLTSGQADELRRLAKAYDDTKKSGQDFRKAQEAAAAASVGMDEKVASLAAKQQELSAAFGSTAAVLKSSGYLNLVADNQKKLADIMAAGMSEENLQQLMDAREQAAESERLYIQNSVAEYAAGLKDKTDALNTSLLTEDEQRQAEYDAEVKHVQEMIALYKAQGNAKAEVLQNMNDYLLALERKHERDMEGPVQQLLRSWSDASKNMQEAAARWLDDATNRVVEFAKTGKFSFSEFAQSVLSDILRIIEQAAIANSLGQSGGKGGLGGILGGILSGIGSGISGMFGSSSGPAGYGGVSGIGNVNWSTGMVGHAHSGGIAGKASPFYRPVDLSVFMGAKRFHGGGMPGLRTDEVPIIAQKGEGVFTRDQMAALGSGTNKGANIQVNVINQSGQVLNAQTGPQRFDGRQMVLDVVLKAASQPGSFRDSLKTVMKQ